LPEPRRTEMKGKDGGTRRKKRQIIVGETDRRHAMPPHHGLYCTVFSPWACSLIGAGADLYWLMLVFLEKNTVS